MRGNLRPIKDDPRRLGEHHQRWLWKRTGDWTLAHRHRRRVMKARLRQLRQV